MKRIYIYSVFNRIWHWTQSMLVVLLILTGLDIHFHSVHLLPFEAAVELHAVCAAAFVVLIVFALFWHITTGQWKQYAPTRERIDRVIRYYTIGIFRNEPHPFHKTELSRHNPLQRLVYLGLNVLVIPVLVTTGFLYFAYNEWPFLGLGSMPLGPVAIIHTAAAYIVIAFLIAHVYLTTTGRTVTSNIKAMFTGWEDVEDDEAQAS